MKGTPPSEKCSQQTDNKQILRFRKSESSHRVDCFREDAKKPFSWVRVRTQHRKGQKGSMKLRKNSGSKKREKSLEISRFLVFPRSDLNWLVIMCLQVNSDAEFVLVNLDAARRNTSPLVKQGLASDRYLPGCNAMLANELMYISFESKFLSVHPSFP